MNLVNLDDETRKYMLEELDADQGAGSIYESPRLSDRGRAEWPTLLRQAIESGDDTTLASSLSLRTHFNPTDTPRTTSTGKVSVPTMATNAPTSLAEGEFNRYYIRGACRRAVAEGRKVEVYRARQSKQPSPESQALIGKVLEPQEVLDDLRANVGKDTLMGVPRGVNSGISVKIV